ncbi:MAG: MarR family transcriptional regulator [Planctomycetota bacterium]
MPSISPGAVGRVPEIIISPAAMRVVRLLVGNPPQSVADLIEATRVTRTAVTEQLNELVAAGFVGRTTERPTGRGRPRHLYTATNNALLFLFVSNQQLVVPAMWEAITEIGGNQLKRKVLSRVSRKVANHYKARITGKTSDERLRQMSDLLTEEGSVVEIDDGGNGELVMRIRSCQFFSMFEETRSVCYVDQEMLRLIVRAPVRRTTCRHDGDPCCSFAIKSSRGK